MGVRLSVGSAQFTMKRSACAKALEALQRLEPAGIGDEDEDADDGELEGAQTFEEGMAALGWQVYASPAGDVLGLELIADKSSVDDQVAAFGAIARFVDDGSYLELEDDEEGQPKKLSFKRGKLRVEAIEELGEPPDPSAWEAQPEALTWRAVASSMPAERRSYSPSSSFRVGEWLEHSRFGPGYVSACGEGKVRVLFADDERVFVHER